MDVFFNSWDLLNLVIMVYMSKLQDLMICGLHTYMYEMILEAIRLRETVIVRIFILYRNNQVDGILLCSEIVANSKDRFHFFTACLNQYQLQ